jgi:hypothetical protein
MIKGLVFARADFGGDRLPPFLGVIENRVNVEDHATERVYAVLDHLADLELGVPHFFHDRAVSYFP